MDANIVSGVSGLIDGNLPINPNVPPANSGQIVQIIQGMSPPQALLNSIVSYFKDILGHLMQLFGLSFWIPVLFFGVMWLFRQALDRAPFTGKFTGLANWVIAFLLTVFTAGIWTAYLLPYFGVG